MFYGNSRNQRGSCGGRGNSLAAQYLMYKMAGGGGNHRRGVGRGNLRFLLLDLINEKPRHGYDLMSEIETRSDGAYKPSPGVVYPALEMLVDMGWVKVKNEDDKRVFHITKAGQEALKENAETISEIKERLDAMKNREPKGEAGDARTAVFRLVRRLRMAAADENMTEAKRAEIVDILVKAEQAIADLK